MAKIDGWSDVVDENMRAVWPVLATAIRGTGGCLMGGTAVAIHLRHRTSEDLDIITLRPFAGRVVANKLRKAFQDSYEEEEVAANTANVRVNGVLVQVFRALPQGIDPDDMTVICEGPKIDGLPVGSIPDLFAAKLDVIMYRPKLRDYIDIAALDRTSGYRIEDGLGFWARRFGQRIQSRSADRIVRLLAEPGTLPVDKEVEPVRSSVLSHLRERSSEVRDYLAELQSEHSPDQDGPELMPKRTDGGIITPPGGGTPTGQGFD